MQHVSKSALEPTGAQPTWEEEPEPAPNTLQRRALAPRRCTSALLEQLERELAAHYQLLQLAAELGAIPCPWAAAAHVFAHLADRLRLDAGEVLDLLLHQGEGIQLPALPQPVSNMAADVDGDVALAGALEGALQVLDGLRRHDFSEAAKRGDPEASRLAEQMYARYRRTRGLLMRHLAAVTLLGNDRSALLHYARSLPAVA